MNHLCENSSSRKPLGPGYFFVEYYGPHWINNMIIFSHNWNPIHFSIKKYIKVANWNLGQELQTDRKCKRPKEALQRPRAEGRKAESACSSSWSEQSRKNAGRMKMSRQIYVKFLILLLSISTLWWRGFFWKLIQ